MRACAHLDLAATAGVVVVKLNAIVGHVRADFRRHGVDVECEVGHQLAMVHRVRAPVVHFALRWLRRCRLDLVLLPRPNHGKPRDVAPFGIVADRFADQRSGKGVGRFNRWLLGRDGANRDLRRLVGWFAGADTDILDIPERRAPRASQSATVRRSISGLVSGIRGGAPLVEYVDMFGSR